MAFYKIELIIKSLGGTEPTPLQVAEIVASKVENGCSDLSVICFKPSEMFN